METRLVIYEPPSDEYSSTTHAFGQDFVAHAPAPVKEEFFGHIERNPHFRFAKEGEDDPRVIRHKQAHAMAERQMKELDALGERHREEAKAAGFTVEDMHAAFDPPPATAAEEAAPVNEIEAKSVDADKAGAA